MIDALLLYAVPACVIIIVVLFGFLSVQCFIEAKQLDDFNKNKGGK